MNRLKPCPFCGADDADVVQKQGGLYKVVASHENDCPFSELAWYDGYETRSDAIRSWNMRAEVRRGHWIVSDIATSNGLTWIECDCGSGMWSSTIPCAYPAYCPSCGAQMFNHFDPVGEPGEPGKEGDVK